MFATQRGTVRRVLSLFALAAAALLTGCANFYVDGNLKDTPQAAYHRPAQPQQVQLVTEFQTKGVSNARATDHVKTMVADAVRASGVFSEVRDTPAPGAGMLSVTLNNVPLTDDAASKGFIAGLTFGAAGQQVTDGYICTVTYLAPGQSTPIVKSVHHALHTTIGAKGSPVNAVKAASADEAIRTIVRQSVSAALNDVSHDPAFR
jgi:hypothetical protein